MTISQTIDYINHRYGEICYEIDNGEILTIFTKFSIWKIYKGDLKRIGRYILYHSNHDDATRNGCVGQYFHYQCDSMDINFLIYYAALHDYTFGALDYLEFLSKANYFYLGRNLLESTEKFSFLTDSKWDY